MDTQKAQIVDRLKQATNILVTVSASPSVDQLASAIGITLLLNKLGKHATAVFSGPVPSVLEFLEPAKTIETNTDSLRDFIISLDKNKADKLRYKVEDDHVRIFITPYRTSISDKDLVFSQGDFNVEVVLAVGITKQQDLDQAIAMHGRILHDATVIDVSVDKITGLGTMNLTNPKASSLSEILVDVGVALKPDVLDSQMATAFLTGIVAQTNRFSNERTTSTTMEISSRLLAAGANQQLVATKLQPPKPATPPAPKPAPVTAAPSTTLAAAAPASLPEPVDKVASDGSLQIDHGPAVDLDTYEFSSEEDEKAKLEQIHIDDQGHLKAVQPGEEPKNAPPTPTTSLSSERKQASSPTTGGTLTASSTDNEQETPVDVLSASGSNQPLLSHDNSSLQMPANTGTGAADNATTEQVLQATNTLEDLERSVHSPHLATEGTADNGTSPAVTSAPPVPGSTTEEARDQVNAAVDVPADQPLPPVQALGAQFADLPGVGSEANQPLPAEAPETVQPVASFESVQPPPDDTDQPAETATVSDPSAPPTVPPPMMPPAFTPSA